MIQITLCRKTDKEIARITYPDVKDVPPEAIIPILSKSEIFVKSYENQFNNVLKTDKSK